MGWRMECPVLESRGIVIAQTVGWLSRGLRQGNAAARPGASSRGPSPARPPAPTTPVRHAVRPTAIQHMSLNLAIGALYAINAWERVQGSVSPTASLLLSAIGIAALLGRIGGAECRPAAGGGAGGLALASARVPCGTAFGVRLRAVALGRANPLPRVLIPPLAARKAKARGCGLSALWRSRRDLRRLINQ